MSSFCKNLLHNWINTFSSDEFCFSGRKDSSNMENNKEETKQEDLSQEGNIYSFRNNGLEIMNERKKNSDIYDYLHQFMKLSQAPDASPEVIHQEACKLMEKLEPYCARYLLRSVCELALYYLQEREFSSDQFFQLI